MNDWMDEWMDTCMHAQTDNDIAVVLTVEFVTRVRVCGYAFKQHGRRSIAKRSIDSVAMSSDPPDVCHATEDVPWSVVEDGLMGEGGEKKVSGLRVDESLWSPGTSRCVEDEQRIFAVHHFDRTVRRLLCQFLQR